MQLLPCLQQAVPCVASLPWPAVTRHVPALIDRHAWPQVGHRQRRPCRRPLPPQRCALPPSLTSALAGRALAADVAALPLCHHPRPAAFNAAALASALAAASAAAIAAAPSTSTFSPLHCQRLHRHQHRQLPGRGRRRRPFISARGHGAAGARFPFAGALSCFCMCFFVVCVLFIHCEILHDWSRRV